MKKQKRETSPVHLSRDLHKEVAAIGKKMGLPLGEAMDHVVKMGLSRVKALDKYKRSNGAATETAEATAK